MAYQIGFVDDTGTEGVAHWQMLLLIKTFAEANGWTTLRYLNPTPYTDSTVVRELILQGVGLGGTEQIFIGFRAYQSSTADYYNLSVAGFTGYVAANAFTAQPGYIESGVCAHNQRIDYWLVVNAQRICCGMKVGTPVYEVAYVGKFLPYATPGQYPYPMACIGTLGAGTPATRYSDTTAGHSSGVKGLLAQSVLRDVLGNWSQFRTLPWTADINNAPTTRRDTGGYYSALKAVLMNGAANNPGGTGNVWGELDGIRYISGFNNLTENTVTIGGVTHVVLQDVFRTGIGDYFLLEMS
ncbi:MAG: hypothetical protein ACYCZD_12760 [Rhodanobacter sp.]